MGGNLAGWVLNPVGGNVSPPWVCLPRLHSMACQQQIAGQAHGEISVLFSRASEPSLSLQEVTCYRSVFPQEGGHPPQGPLSDREPPGSEMSE